MRFTDYLTLEGISTSLRGRNRNEALAELSELAAAVCPGLSSSMILEGFLDRERLATTGVGSGIAIPHGRFPVCDFAVAIGIAPSGVAFGAVDGEPVYILVALLAPQSSPAGQLRMLARISKLLRPEATRSRLRAAVTPREVLDALTAQEQRSAMGAAGV